MSLARRLPNTLRSLLLDELVADPPDRLDPAGGARELLAQPGNVNVDGPGIAEVIEAPDEVQQALAVEHQPEILRESEQQVEFFGAQRDWLVADCHLAPRRVD